MDVESEPRAAAVSPDVVEGQAPAIVEGHFVENCHSSNNNKISIVVACGSCEVHNHVDVPRHTYYVVTVGTSVGIFQSAVRPFYESMPSVFLTCPCLTLRRTLKV